MSPHTVDTEDDEVKLLTPWYRKRLPSLLNVGADAWDSFRLLEAVQLLKASALISTASSGDRISVSKHPLVHAWAQDRQRPDEQHENWLSMGCVMAFAYRSWKTKQTHYRSVQEHVEAVADWKFSTMLARAPPVLVVRVLVNCGWLLHCMGSDKKLSILIESIIDSQGLDHHQVEPRWIGLYRLAARNLVDNGQTDPAVALLEQLAQHPNQSLAANHSMRLASVSELGEAYLMSGKP